MQLLSNLLSKRWQQALGVLAAGVLSASAMAADIKVSDPVVREVPAVSTNTAAFMTLENKGKEAVRLVGADSEVAARVEVHGHKMEGDIMRMYKVDEKGVDISPGGTLKLESGGYHIMIMGLKHSLKAGQDVNITLHFSDGDAIDVKAPVKDLRNEKDMAHDKHKGHGADKNDSGMSHHDMKH